MNSCTLDKLGIGGRTAGRLAALMISLPRSEFSGTSYAAAVKQSPSGPLGGA